MKETTYHPIAKGLHWVMALMILGLLAHVGAALKHHFVDRDDILRRMWMTRRPSPHKEPL
jgi:cytochrome b561